MPALYRFVIGKEEFVLPGRVEKAEGVFVLIIQASLDQAMQIRGVGVKAERKARVEVIVGDKVVAVMPMLSVEVGKPAGGSKVDLWIIVG